MTTGNLPGWTQLGLILEILKDPDQLRAIYEDIAEREAKIVEGLQGVDDVAAAERLRNIAETEKNQIATLLSQAREKAAGIVAEAQETAKSEIAEVRRERGDLQGVQEDHAKVRDQFNAWRQSEQLRLDGLKKKTKDELEEAGRLMAEAKRLERENREKAERLARAAAEAA